MKLKSKKLSGLSLTETVVIIATIALLVGLGIPAVRAFVNSFENGSGTKGIISTALSSVRAIAAKEQKYAGIRFQKQNNIQYAVFIVHDLNIPYPDDGKTIPFIALKGYKLFNFGRENITTIDNNDEVTIVFSSEGRLIRKWVKVFSNPAKIQDDIFGQYGLFPEDEDSELSDNSLVVKNRNDPNSSKTFYVNRYMGTLI